jgi:hypothetical protein
MSNAPRAKSEQPSAPSGTEPKRQSVKYRPAHNVRDLTYIDNKARQRTKGEATTQAPQAALGKTVSARDACAKTIRPMFK